MRANWFRAGLSAAAIVCALPGVVGTQGGSRGVAIDSDDIGGVVTSSKGPEAGVWVVAETNDLPTRFSRIVVTDDQGRYLLPDLPPANYQIFVRGYGLIDSARVAAKVGQRLNLTAVVAPDARAAAQVYPANYWLSLLEFPKGEAPEEEALSAIKECMTCHQLGGLATRTLPKSGGTLSMDAWDHRVRGGPSGAAMSAMYSRLKSDRKMLADWTDRIAAGAFPRQVPSRPSGVERNLVVTLWEWVTPTSGRSDAAATDERNPTVNAHGLVYAAIQSDDVLAWLDPRQNRTGTIKIPSTAPPFGQNNEPSPFWGQQNIWLRSADPRSVALDQQGRVWVAARSRAQADQPAFCKPGSTNKFARYYPMPGPSNRQVAIYDPRTRQFAFVDTCFSADHNQFLTDADSTIVYGQPNSVSWINTALFDKTHDSEASQGWCPAVLDTNGDGRITEWTEPDQPVDVTKDHRIQFTCYSVTASPDGSLWCSASGAVAQRDDKIVRLERGSNPPQTCKAEVYQPPVGQTPPIWGSGGSHVDQSGVVWTDWRGSDHVTSFDRRKCKGPLNGPKATGQQCPEGWTVYRKPGATLQGLSVSNNSDLLYLTQIDRHNALGLGEGVVLTGNVNSDELLAVLPRTGQLVELRIPYPLGFFSRSTSGRIDDPKIGWKGRGLWSSFSSYTPWHLEGGKGARPRIAKMQARPTPLSK